MDILTGTTFEHMVDENKRLFEGLLSELVKRLILHSCSGINQIRIPGKDDVWAPGFDGFVQNSVSTKYVCEGTSVWECGTNRKPLKKINDDYDKRTTNSLGVDKTNTEFYLVVPYVWAFNNQGESITEWESEHKSDWKNVHVFDATVLADWINAEPAACAWLLEQVGREKEIDFSTVKYAWERFSSKTSPVLSNSLFLYSRENEVSNFWNSIENQVIRVKADSTIDSYGFCLSALLKKEELVNSIIVVNNQSTYKALSKYCKEKIFLLNFRPDCDAIPGNRVIICYNKEDKAVKTDIELLPLARACFENALKDMGLPDNEVYTFYRKTHGNLLSLIRKIPGSVPGNAPKWASQDRIELLTPLLFLRSFDTTNEYDRNLIVFLANESYERIIDRYNTWIGLEDAPVKRIDSHWILIDFEEAWEVLNISVRSPSYDRLLLAIETIVAVNNVPSKKSDLKIADYRSKRYLRNLFLDLVYFSNTDEAKVVSNFVQSFLKQHPSSSLVLEHLSLLAEAAPSVVMSFLENQENQPGGIVDQYFSTNSYSHDYCNLLFALDEMVLHEETRVRACDFLYRLCKKTQSTKFALSNSPRESLLIALCLWNECTLFTLEEKESLIRKYLSEKDDFTVGFVTDLLLKNLITLGNREDKKYIPKMSFSRNEITDTTNKIANDLFRHIIKNHCLEELVKLLKDYNHFYNETLLEASNLFGGEDYSPDELIPLNYEMRCITYYASKDDSIQYWMTSLKKWIDITTPQKCIYREGWMFYEYNSYLYFEEDEKETSTPNRKGKINELRKTTLDKLVQTNNPCEIASLVHCSKDEYEMGFFYGRNLRSEYIYSLANEASRLKKDYLLCGIIESSEKTDCIHMLDSLNTDDQLMVLSYITRNDILEWLDTTEKERAFWNHQKMRAYDKNTYKKLLTYNPFNLLPYYAYTNEHPLATSIEEIKEVVRAVLATCSISTPQNSDPYALDRIISKLNNEGYMSEEWVEICTKLYDNNLLSQYPDILKEYYFAHPDILCDKLLEMSGNANSEFNSYYELPNRAYTDSYAFICFVDAFFARPAENDLLISVLGSILGKSREGADKIFPHEYVRMALEKYKDTDLWREVLSGKIYSRGARFIGDGSDRKRLAEEVKNNAKKVEIDYPETARLLRELSKYYASEGKQDRLYSEIGASAW
ncbi:MAG: hypothetical protein K6G89_04195 [Clostridia bacterium]|nr:hypothetical protein [Clostridia bacterium]